MRAYSREEAKPVIDLVSLIEKVVVNRNLDKFFSRKEIEKVFFSILEGKDNLNPYERRQQGIDDYEWHERIKSALYFLNLKGSYEKIYKN
jgi:hypothetical protein